jgi:signal transduction histidine kinase
VLGLAGRAGRLSLSVADDGLGMAQAPPATPAAGASRSGGGSSSGGSGMGLRIMKSRAELIGGTLRIGPNHPSGTIVSCEVPETP